MIELKFSGSNVRVTFPDGRIVIHDGVEAKDLVSVRYPEVKWKWGHDQDWMSAHNVIAAAWITSFRCLRRRKTDGIEMSIPREIFVNALDFVSVMQTNPAASGIFMVDVNNPINHSRHAVLNKSLLNKIHERRKTSLLATLNATIDYSQHREGVLAEMELDELMQADCDLE